MLTPQIVIALLGLAVLALLPVLYRKLRARAARDESDDLDVEFADALDPAVQDVAALDRAHAFGRAHEDQSPAASSTEAGQAGDGLGDRPDVVRRACSLDASDR